MKNILSIIPLLSLAFLISCSGTQQASSTSLVKAEFEVGGACGMCKDRIEEAVAVRGVKTADYNLEKNLLTVVYVPSKVSLETIEKMVANVGHDTPNVKSKDATYNALEGCCHYRSDAKNEAD